MARPRRVFTDDERSLLLRVLLEGATLKKALRLLQVDRLTFSRMRERDPTLSAEVDRAQAEGVEAALDNHEEELEDCKGENLRAGDARLLRVKGDLVRWKASRLKRDKYGDRVDVVVSLPDVAGAIAAARSRAVLTQQDDVSCADPKLITDETVDADDDDD